MTYGAELYASVDELKAWVTRSDVSIADDDAQLLIAVTAASRAIDAHCNRTFGLTGSATARVFDFDGLHLEGRCAVKITDLQTTVGLAVTADYAQDYQYSTTLTLNTDFDLWPWNAAADGVPWTHLVLRPSSAAYLTACVPEARLFSISGNWGWTTVPTLVKQACLLQASRWFMRRDAWAGVAGSPDLGNEIRLLSALDPDVQLALSSLVRVWGAA